MNNESDSDSLMHTNKNTYEIDLLSDEDDSDFEMENLSIKNSAADKQNT